MRKKIKSWYYINVSLFFVLACSPSASRASNQIDTLATDKRKEVLEIVKLEKEIAALQKPRDRDDTALIVSIVGILAGILSGIYAGKTNAKIELDKYKRERQGGFETEIRNTIKELTTDIGSAGHSMCWLCWLARYGPEKLTTKALIDYDKELHKLLPKLTGKFSIIAGMNFAVYDEIAPLVYNVYGLDAKIAAAGLTFSEGNLDSAKGLAALHEESLTLLNDIPRIIGQAVKRYSTKT